MEHIKCPECGSENEHYVCWNCGFANTRGVRSNGEVWNLLWMRQDSKKELDADLWQGEIILLENMPGEVHPGQQSHNVAQAEQGEDCQ